MKRDLPAFWSVSTYGIPFNDERLAMGGAVNLYQVSWEGGGWVGSNGGLARRYCTHLFDGKRLPVEGAARDCCCCPAQILAPHMGSQAGVVTAIPE